MPRLPAAATLVRKAVLPALAASGVAAALALASLDPPANAEDAAKANAPSAFSSEQRAEIEKVVKDYLLAHPELLIEVQGALEAKMEKEQAEKLKAAITENAKEIYRPADASVAGNEKGDITVVEFFDYNCGYCKRALSGVVKLVENDKNVRVVFKELPILSKGSEEAARVALAARAQGKYWEFHKALLGGKGQANEASALAAAEKLGLDMDRLKKDMESESVKSEIAKVQELAQKMGINGTPHFLIGDRSIPGAPEDLHDQLEKHVTELRKTGCAYC